MDFTELERSYYSRQLNLAEIGLEGQRRLRQARVLCIGAGGIGSSALLYLAAAGVGKIGIIDDDRIKVSHLQRQVLYAYPDIGKKKVSIAEARLQQLNPTIQIKSYDTKLTRANALDILQQYDIIADGSDDFATRYLVNDVCFQLKKPHVYTNIVQYEGLCTVLTANKGPCFRCLFAELPPSYLVPHSSEAGMLGVLPGVMGTLQATEIIKLILGIGTPLIGRVLIFNALNMHFRERSVSSQTECQLCQSQKDFDTLLQSIMNTCLTENKMITETSVTELNALRQQNADIMVLDVREPDEYAICNIGGTLIPMGELAERLNELDKNKRIIVHCRSGGRSKRAVEFLQSQGFTSVSNLTGGIRAWIDQIDPSLTTY